jgi:hypothetical protein
MKDTAWLDYELDGKKYRWTGDPLFYESHPKLHAALKELVDEECAGKAVRLPEDCILRAGGKIIEIHSIRPDGSVKPEDFRDGYVN